MHPRHARRRVLASDTVARRRPDRPAQPAALALVELEHGFACRSVHDAGGGERLDIDTAGGRGGRRVENPFSVGEADNLLAGHRIPDDRRPIRQREDVAGRPAANSARSAPPRGGRFIANKGAGEAGSLVRRAAAQRTAARPPQPVSRGNPAFSSSCAPTWYSCRDQKSILTNSSLSAFILCMATSTASCLATSKKPLGRRRLRVVKHDRHAAVGSLADNRRQRHVAQNGNFPAPAKRLRSARAEDVFASPVARDS